MDFPVVVINHDEGYPVVRRCPRLTPMGEYLAKRERESKAALYDPASSRQVRRAAQRYLQKRAA